MTTYETGDTAMDTSSISGALGFVLDEIRRDVAEGLYEDAYELGSFGMLHDYVDANDYLTAASERFCRFHDRTGTEEGYMLWLEWTNELTDAVDTALYRKPIPVPEVTA